MVIDSLSLGTAAVAPRERVEAQFAAILRESLEAEPGRGEVSELAIRGVVGGARRVVYRCLRGGHPERFGEHASEFLDWALGYRRPAGEGVLEESFFAALAAAPRPVEAKAGQAVQGLIAGGTAPPAWKQNS